MQTEAASSKVILFPSLKLSSFTILVSFNIFAICDTVLLYSLVNINLLFYYASIKPF